MKKKIYNNVTEINEFQYSSINNNTLPLEKYWFPPFLRIAKIDKKSIVPITTNSMLKRVYHMIIIQSHLSSDLPNFRE